MNRWRKYDCKETIEEAYYFDCPICKKTSSIERYTGLDETEAFYMCHHAKDMRLTDDGEYEILFSDENNA